MGHGLRTMCAVLDEIAQRCPSTGMIYTMHLCGVSTYVAAADRMAPCCERRPPASISPRSPSRRPDRGASSGRR